MALDITPSTEVTRDDDGHITELDHSGQPFRASEAALAAADASPRAVAEQYLREVGEHFRLGGEELSSLAEEVTATLAEEGPRLRFRREKNIAGLAVVHYAQTCLGLPVWNTSVAVQVDTDDSSVVGSSSQIRRDLEPRWPDLVAARFAPEHISPDTLRGILGLGEGDDTPVVNGKQLMVYRYDPEDREHELSGAPRDTPLEGGLPRLDLAAVDETAFPPGSDHVVVEVLFTLSRPGWQGLHWQALVEPETGTVLYIRPLAAGVQGSVFAIDPVTQGCPTCTGATDTQTLDLYRTELPLQGLTPAIPPAPQKLEGDYVKIEDLDPPDIAPPSEPTGSDFVYDSTTNDFTAVNAYYHCDYIYRYIDGMGISVASYFDGTTFPVPVDFRGKNGQVNASCNGNAGHDGTGKFLFGLVESGQPVGIATAFRVVWHEFGHALLWDHVDSPNFGFAHSAGDSMAAIYADPSSQALDKGLTFPFLTGSNPNIVRRHDRPVATWAWFGVNYNTQYSGEQVLSTTLFRAYQSTGGGSDILSYKQFASQYMLYLIVKSCGLLTATTRDPKVYANKLKQADMNTADFKGVAGGTNYKVIRWSFEQQGLYQATGTPRPYTAPGQPPANDVYVDDGRDGGYSWIADWKNTQDIWNRLAADGGTSNQPPVAGETNYLYVRVKNRGTESAADVAVRSFQQKQGTEGNWPNDWQATTTATLSAGTIASQGETVVGPFQWTPAGFADESALMVAANPSDPAIIDNPKISGKILGNWRLVPFDNNIAQRAF